LAAPAAELIVQGGVAYADPDELALDRALGRVGDESEAVTLVDVDLEAELERRVAAFRQLRPAVPAAVAAPAISQPVTTAAGNCPQCGYAFDAGDRFCVRCGTSLIQVCPNCGHAYDAGDLFCAKCGQKLMVSQ
jgi:hypothetical protein